MQNSNSDENQKIVREFKSERNTLNGLRQLLCARSSQSLDCIRQLLRSAKQVNLLCARSSQSLDCIRQLLRSAKQVNLLCARSSQSLDCIRQLLRSAKQVNLLCARSSQLFKKVVLFVFFFSFLSVRMYADDYAPYRVKAAFIAGYVFADDKQKRYLFANEKNGIALGGEFAFEFGSKGNKVWEKAYKNPNLGIALQFLDLGRVSLLGQMISLYPYVNLPLIKNKYIRFDARLGLGLAYCTNPFDRKEYVSSPDKNDEYQRYNFAIGSYLNAIISVGFNVEVPIQKKLNFTANLGFIHFSNGSTRLPNAGVNMLNGAVGLKYMPTYKEACILDTMPKITKRFFGEITLGGGVKQLHYANPKMFGVGRFSVAGYYKVGHKYRVGLGLDTYYDGSHTNYPTDNIRTVVPTDEFKNKIRMGVCIANDLLIGRLIASFQVGMYVYDPVKNFQPYREEDRRKKGLIYPYNIGVEDGWCYFKVAVKYSITPSFLVGLSLKSHLSISDFIEFGVGYTF